MTQRHLGKALTAAVAGFALVGLAAIPAAAHPHQDDKLGDKLARKVTGDNVLAHVKALQKIADRNGGTRAASTPGHEASVHYVVDRLEAAGYDVRTQEFPFTFVDALAESLTVVSPSPSDVPVFVMDYSTSTPVGGITAPLALAPLDADETHGCDASDYAPGSATGKVVLVKRGGCPFAQKQQVAGAAGAVAAIVYNREPGELHGTLSDPAAGVIPTGGITQAAGEALAAQAAAGPVTVTVDLRQFREDRVTRNIVAESKWGDADNVVMAGAHLDSVTKGPGINDNGSGSAALLETALQLARYEHRPANKVRFAWWSAEEFNLLGSSYYVESLTPEEQRKIALYLNFDMIASPNFAEFVYDGDGSGGGSEAGPAGSAEIEAFINGYLDRRGSGHEPTDFDGRSDYGPFIEVGIPAGGTFTGAEKTKTAEEAATYGGQAGTEYDVCYHKACDNLSNINKRALDLNADVIAYAMGVFANDTHMINGDSDGNPGLPPAPARTSAAAAAPIALHTGYEVA
jgi:Zn-dependent M28 family amino/carboxypeptidase